MLIDTLEKKWKLSFAIAALGIIGGITLSVFTIWTCLGMIQTERKKIYVLDGDVPILVKQTSQEINQLVEAKSHVNLFHNLFFTLAPDDKYIQYNLEKAMYLIDESGIYQRNSMAENGFYSNIMSSSAVSSIMCDSINVNIADMSFVYYGTQRIERRTSITKREMVTAGRLQTVPRTENNPHGLIITNWRPLRNTQIDYKTKGGF